MMEDGGRRWRMVESSRAKPPQIRVHSCPFAVEISSVLFACFEYFAVENLGWMRVVFWSSQEPA